MTGNGIRNDRVAVEAWIEDQPPRVRYTHGDTAIGSILREHGYEEDPLEPDIWRHRALDSLPEVTT